MNTAPLRTLVACIVFAFLPVPEAHAGGPQPIIQVELEDDMGTVSVTGLRATTGYPDVSWSGEHVVVLLDGDGAVLGSHPFGFNHVIHVPPDIDGTHQPPLYRNRVTLTLNVALPAAAETVRVRAGGLAESYSTRNLPVVRPALPPPVVIHQGCADENQCFKFLFIAEDYTQATLSQFASTAQTIANFFLAMEPYKGVADKMNIYRFDNLTDLGCEYNCSGIARLICCNDSSVSSAAAGAPRDEVLVIVNNNEYGGSGSLEWGMCFDAATFAVTYKDLTGIYGADWTAKQVAVHETGHSMGGLWDEYEYGISGNYGEGPNCIHDNTCALWNGTPGTGCFAGCSYDGMYRPTQNGCLMNTFSPTGGFKFCPVCINYFQAKVAQCIGGTVTCNSPPNACYEPNGTYDNGVCQYDYLPQGTPCDDANGCTSPDRCNGAGTCAGTPLVCNTPPNAQCYQSTGSCAENGCYYNPRPDLTPCNDGNACTQHDRCDGQGNCEGTPDPSCGQDGGAKDGGAKDTGAGDAGTKDAGRADAGKEDGGESDGSAVSDAGAQSDAASPADGGQAADGGATGKDAGRPEPGPCECDRTFDCDEGCGCDPECSGGSAGLEGEKGCSCSHVGT
ncbi:MAG: hypothetical protein HY897_22675 [Deltaproteobacteria bacterium]|nr:hypothetical protein [Deltaproteobacteria bacterium]